MGAEEEVGRGGGKTTLAKALETPFQIQKAGEATKVGTPCHLLPGMTASAGLMGDKESGEAA